MLSDANKRFMYDVGAYDSDDDEDDQNVSKLRKYIINGRRPNFSLSLSTPLVWFTRIHFILGLDFPT